MAQPENTPKGGAAAASRQDTLAMLERRRIEAGILAHVYAVLKERDGAKLAADAIAEAVRRSAMEQARQMAAAVGGNTTLETFIERQEAWTRGGALEIAVVEQSATRYRYNVTRCKYAEMYRAMGLAEIGHLLSCQRDATFCEGYDRRLALKRTQTIMQGASHCDFDYTFDRDPQA